MKRFLLITAAAVVLAALFFWGYILYQQQTSYDTLIPANTATLVRVDMYRIYRSLSSSLFKRRRSERHFFKGLSVPANLFCYTLKDGPEHTLFTTLPVDDTTALTQSLAGMGFSRLPVPAGNMTFAANSSQTCVLAYNEAHVAFAFSPAKEAVQETLARLLKQENMIAVSQSAFSKIKSLDGHLTLLSEKGKGRLDFRNGSIAAELDWQADSIKTWELPMERAATGDALDLYWLGLAPQWLAGKQFKAGDVVISGDSLLAAHPRGFILKIGETVVQKDSVVTYDYNDDFEKVATVSVKENKVPGIRLQVLAEATLYDYLRRAGMVSKDSNILQPEVFPLYKIYTGTLAGGLWAGTSAQAPAPVPELATGPFLFYLQADFDRLKQVPDLAWLNRYTSPFKSVSAHARQLRDKRIVLDLSLTCRKPDESALLQLPQLF
ncbi:hypothetical protein [Taibaiella helva]|uniref:hypothetical protein n=1 Tax=Taibaiella helva TaxID=2301235 RepID=UPI000E58C40E|nr:hypothetical protein [Taibaiella helva]